MTLEWLRPEIIFGSILYAVIGIGVLGLFFVSLQSASAPSLPQRNSISTTAPTNIHKKTLASSDPLKAVGNASRCKAARLSAASRNAPTTASAASVSPADQTTSRDPWPSVCSRFSRFFDAAPVPT